MLQQRLVMALATVALLLPTRARAGSVELRSGQVRVTTGGNVQLQTERHRSRGARRIPPASSLNPGWVRYQHSQMSCYGGSYLSSQQVSSRGGRTVMVQSSTCGGRAD